MTDIKDSEMVSTVATEPTESGASCAPTSGRERPSRHGQILGQVLAALAEDGRRDSPPLPPMCATCAFREGCMTNQMTATGLAALNCVLGIDRDRFACHHGMNEGEPTKLCAGHIAARAASFIFVKKAMAVLSSEVANLSGPDHVREAFDAWIASVDPGDELDDHQRGRLYLKAFPVEERPQQNYPTDASKASGRDE